MAWTFGGIPQLRVSATANAPRNSGTNAEERVEILSRFAPDVSKKSVTETNQVPLIVALDEDNKLITRQATVEEAVELKTNKTNKGKTKKIVEAIKQVFIPEE